MMFNFLPEQLEMLKQPLNILFYGNSYTRFNGGIERVVRDLAVAAGYPAPRAVSAAIDGYTLSEHRYTNTAPINAGIPANQNWDFVVMQDFSMLPTRIGNPNLHVSAATALFNLVRTRSPLVTPVMFQTWARRQDNYFFYTAPNPHFPLGVSQMQRDLRNNYLRSADAIDTATGMEFTRVAWAGDAWQEANYYLLHTSDTSHPAIRGTLLAGMVIFSTIYQTPMSAMNYMPAAENLGVSDLNAAPLAAAADRIFSRPRPVFTPDPPPPPPPPPPCPGADYNADGEITPDDLADFIGAYFAAPPEITTDFDNNGQITPDDLADYIAAYFQAC